MKVHQLLEARETVATALKAELLKVCEAFYKERGAVMGKEQTAKDLNLKGGGFAGIPTRFTEDTKFITKEVTITGGGGASGRDIQASLWVIPLKKDGSQGQPLRLTYVDISKY